LWTFFRGAGAGFATVALPGYPGHGIPSKDGSQWLRGKVADSLPVEGDGEVPCVTGSFLSKKAGGTRCNRRRGRKKRRWEGRSLGGERAVWTWSFLGADAKAGMTGITLPYMVKKVSAGDQRFLVMHADGSRASLMWNACTDTGSESGNRSWSGIESMKMREMMAAAAGCWGGFIIRAVASLVRVSGGDLFAGPPFRFGG